MLRFSMGNAILNKLMNSLISLARDVVVPPLVTSFKLSAEVYPPSTFQHKHLAGTPD